MHRPPAPLPLIPSYSSCFLYHPTSNIVPLPLKPSFMNFASIHSSLLLHLPPSTCSPALPGATSPTPAGPWPGGWACRGHQSTPATATMAQVGSFPLVGLVHQLPAAPHTVTADRQQCRGLAPSPPLITRDCFTLPLPCFTSPPHPASPHPTPSPHSAPFTPSPALYAASRPLSSDPSWGCRSRPGRS